MGFINVVRNSFSLLRKKPQIFLPKVALNLVWSIIWLTVATTLKQPTSFTPRHYLILGGFILVLTPVNIWIFNSYVFLVRQFREKRFSMRKAFRKGLRKMPQSLSSMAITSILTLLVSIPGILITLHGISSDSSFITLSGYILTGISVTSVFISFYLVPASVITGKDSFRKNFRNGFQASVEMRQETAMLAIITILLLVSTVFLEGFLRNIGIVGYLGFRMVYGVVNVYILLLNPSLLMDYKKKEGSGQKLNGLETKIQV